MATNVFVNDTCAVDTSTVVIPQSTRTRGKNVSGRGTRVFGYDDISYCSPRFEHNDNQWAVFICFRNSNIDKVVSILKANSGRHDIFKKHPELSNLGGYYQLAEFEKFGYIYI